MQMSLETIILVGIAVVLLGISKAGFGGVGVAVALPVMSLGIEPALALGVLLPLLLATDVVSISAHGRHMDMRAILFAVPGGIVGVLLGALVIDLASPAVIAGMIGVLAILFAVMALTDKSPDVSGWPSWVGSLFGGLSGLTSTIAHAGGPPIHIYFLAKAYAPQAFVATSAGFMAAVNLMKIGPYVAIGALNLEALKLAAMLAPLAVGAAFGGVYLARVLPKRTFKIAVNWLLVLAGLKLLFDAFS